MKIHIKKSNVGKFNATKAATGKSTEELTHSSNPVTKKRAVFAQNAAKWSHKEFGGALKKFMKEGGDVEGLQTFMQNGGKLPRYDGGGPWNTTGNIPADVTAGRDSAQTTAESQTSNTPLTTQMDDFNTQQAQQQAVSPKYATNATPVDVNIDNGQYTPSPQAPVPPKQSNNSYGTGADAFGNLLGAGLASASFFEDRRNQRNQAAYNRQQGISDNVFQAQKMNTAGNRGSYNQQGVFRPNQNTPYAPAMSYPTAQMGGYQGPYTGSVPQSQVVSDIACYAMGGEFNDVPDEHLNELRKRGFKIDYI